MSSRRGAVRSALPELDYDRRVSTQRSSRAEEAVQRSLRRRQEVAQADVARLLAVGRELFGGGGDPRVADIVRAAGVSIEAFYRYFGSKAEFVAAVAEDGAQRVTAYVARRAEGVEDPAKRLRTVVAALMSQAERPELAAAARNILGRAGQGGEGSSFRDDLARLLAPTLVELGSADAERDARVAAITLVGVLEHHVWGESAPTKREVDHLAGFLARAVS